MILLSALRIGAFAAWTLATAFAAIATPAEPVSCTVSEADPSIDDATAAACTAWRSASTAEDRAKALIAIAGAVRGGPREADADALLDAAAAELGEPTAAHAAIEGELEFRRTVAAADRLEDAVADRHLALARARLDAAGQQQSVLYAQVIGDQATMMILERRFDQAAAVLDEADRILELRQAGRSAAAAELLRQRTNMAFTRQDLPGTLALAERNLALRRELGGPDSADAIDPLASIGAVRSMQSDFTGAEAALQEALRIAALNPTRLVDDQLTLLSNLATMYVNRAEEDRALPVALRGVDIADRRYGPDSAQSFRMLLTLGVVYEALGRYADGWRTYERAAANEVKVRASVGLQRRIRLAFGQARIALRLGDAEGARDALARTRTLMGDATGLDYWRGYVAALECKLSARDRDWPAADGQCGEGVRLLGKMLSDTTILALTSRVGRCLAQSAGRLAGTACDDLDASIEADAIDNPTVRCLALAGLAQRAEADGDLDRALGLRLRALATAQVLGRPDPLWTAQAALASLLDRRGHRDLAIFFGKLGVRSIEAMRRQFDADTARFERGFLSDKLGVYRQLADWLFAAGRYDEALEVARLLKTEEQFDFTERTGTAGTGVGPHVTPREAGFERDWQRVDALPTGPADAGARTDRLARMKRLTADEQAALERLTREGVRRERELASLMRAFIEARSGADRAAPGGLGSRDSGPAVTVPIPTSQRDLFAVLLMAEDHVNLFVSSARGTSLQRIDIRPEALGVMVGRYLEAMEQRADAGSHGRELDRLIGVPLDRAAAAVDAQRIVVVTDGVLRYLPLGALRGVDGYLVERYAIEYAAIGTPGAARGTPSNGVPPARARGGEVRAFGVTRAWGSLPALPGVRQELCDIVHGPVVGLDPASGTCANGPQGDGAMDGAGYADAQFTQERTRLSLEADDGFGVLHIGTHFSLRPGNADKSWLLLGDGAHLTLDTLHGYDFRGLRLVTLSACQTGMAGAVGDDGREVEGLPFVIQAQGVQAVVSSLWRVEDRATAQLMAAFYRRLQAGVTPAESLRQAQLDAMHGTSRSGVSRHPYYWAAFRYSTAVDLAAR